MNPTALTEMVDRVFSDRYRIEELIGVGPLSAVYAAFDVVEDRWVALKVFDEAVAEDQPFIDRLFDAVEQAAVLGHPNIVEIYDWGFDDGPFVVSELCEGGSLAALLASGQTLAASQALVMALECARALNYGHEQGAIHRKITPNNVLFSSDEHVRISDYGLAKVLADAPVPRASRGLESVRYASPEQARGRQIGEPTDLYSLALVVNQAVSGRAPAVADTVVGTLMERAESPASLDPALEGLLGPIERCGRVDPTERPEAEELAIALLATAETMPRPGALPLVGIGADAGPLHESDLRVAGGRMATAPAADSIASVAAPAAEPGAVDGDAEAALPDPASRAANPLSGVPVSASSIDDVDLAIYSGDFDPTGREANAEVATAQDSAGDHAAELDAAGLDAAEVVAAQPVGDATEPESGAADLDDPDLDDPDLDDPDLGDPDLDDPDLGDPDVGDPAAEEVDDLDAADLGSPDDLVGFGESEHERFAELGDLVEQAASPGQSIVQQPGAGGLDNLEKAEPVFAAAPEIEVADQLDVPEQSPGRRTAKIAYAELDDDAEDRLPWWPLLVLGLLVAGAIAAGVYFFGGVSGSDSAQVPDLIGVSYDDLDAAIAGRDWQIERLEDRIDGTTVGSIVAQSPSPGTDLEDGETLSVTVSLGNQMVEIPSDVIGLSVEQASSRLGSVGLTVGRLAEENSEEFAAGLVIGLDEPTTQKPTGQGVSLRVSLGAEDRIVPPSVIGMAIGDATSLLVGLRLQAVEETAYSPDAAVGTVLASIPASGEVVPADSAVVLIVSAGPEPVEMPDIVGFTLEDAVDEIEALGLIWIDTEGTPGEDVIGSLPPIGELTDVGTEVTIILGEPAEDEG